LLSRRAAQHDHRAALDIVAAYSDFLHKRATTREDVVEYFDTH
jgi:hypothetical protein